MTNGVPQTKAQQLFNQMTVLGIEDADAAQALVPELRLLCKQTPTSFIARVTFAEALLLAGHRDDAIEQISTSYSLRDVYEQSAIDRLAMLLMFTAQRVRAIEVVRQTAFAPGLINAVSAENHLQIAMWAVDVALLKDLAAHYENQEQHGLALYFLNFIEAFPDIGTLEMRQRILFDIVGQCQVAASAAIIPDDAGELVFVNTIFFDSTKSSRRELEKTTKAAMSSQIPKNTRHLVSDIFTAAPRATEQRIVPLRPQPFT